MVEAVARAIRANELLGRLRDIGLVRLPAQGGGSRAGDIESPRVQKPVLAAECGSTGVAGCTTSGGEGTQTVNDSLWRQKFCWTANG